MPTDSKIDANRANAQHSTRPTTPAGKAVSSRNAMTHGLTAKTVLLTGEDSAEYDTLAKGMLESLNPLDTVEASLAQELIDLQWRLRRIPGLEARILDADSPDTKTLNNISLHAARMKRQFSATLKEFQHLHAGNTKRWNDRLEDALKIYQADQILERESTLAQVGFDFTTEYLQSVLDRRQAFEDADEALMDDKFGSYDQYMVPDDDDCADEEDELDEAA